MSASATQGGHKEQTGTDGRKRY